MKKYRIRKLDDKNLVIEKFSPSRVMVGGKHKGKISEDGWSIMGYYGKLEHVVSHLLKYHIDGAFNNGQELVAEIKRAKKEILEALKNV